ncbi:MAG: class I tRNA ligase family protein [Minisyncoccia bacterium]
MARERFDHAAVERKWQDRWAEEKVYRAKEEPDKPKSYVLDMFPYPSGEGLHVGHPKGYIAGDIYSRMKRMQGQSVLHPMGWDAFGLPAENFALKNKVHPRVAVEKNIAHFKEQLAHIGFDYDWSREINTTDPAYYKWTQWIFLKMFEHGLAYQSDEPINWCPSCMTGLANEDLDNGMCERCGTAVIKKKLPQWVLKITDYADRLLKDLDTLDWPEHIKESQRNWIGRSEGLIFSSPVKDMDLVLDTFSAHFEAFKADTFLVIAPDHKLLRELVVGLPNEKEVLGAAAKMLERRTEAGPEGVKEIEGVFTGRYTIDPVGNGELPIWVANYALADYGTGIVKCSAHDERDFAFAKKYGIPLKEVLEPIFTQTENSSAFRVDEPYADHQGVIVVLKHWSENKYLGLGWKNAPDWGTLLTGTLDDGFTPEETVLKEIVEETGYKNATITRKLGTIHGRYYHVPKQKNRIGHTPVFLVELSDDARTEISEEERTKHELLWLSPDEMKKFLTAETHKYAFRKATEDFAWTDFGNALLSEPEEFKGRNAREAREDIIAYCEKNGLARRKTAYRIKDWVFSRQRYWGEPIPIIHCAKCGAVAVPYEDLPVTLPEVDHYEPTGTGESPLAAIADWVNVKCPRCKGVAKRETNTMPQWAGSSWYYLRFMDPHDDEQLVSAKAEKYWAPVDVYIGGDHAVRHLIYARFWHKFLYDIAVVSTQEPFKRLEFLGFILAEDGRKMSKRLGNVINPDDVVAEYGADAFRLYEMFMGPFENTTAWSTTSIAGAARFVERVWRAAELVKDNAVSALANPLAQVVKKVEEDIVAFKFNTAVSAMMIFLGALEKEGAVGKGQWMQLLKLLAPFAPHLAEELWAELGEPFSIHLASWPSYDESTLVKDEVEVVVQVDGRKRGTIRLAPTAEEAHALAEALKIESVAFALGGRAPARIVYRPARILNLIPEGI